VKLTHFLILATWCLALTISGGAAWADDEPPAEEPTPAPTTVGQFQFGSYGRVQISDDMDGHRGYSTNVVAHGPRIFEPSYGELDFAYTIDAPDDFGSRILFTLALFEPLAHYSGEYDQTFAVRNMYAEAWGFVPYVPAIHAWVGSRMYRGDDVYLLDFWPLDNLNTVGGGLGYVWNGLDVRAHIGVNRLADDYQFQTIEVPGAANSSREKLLLDRQRWIYSGRAQYGLNIWRGVGIKGVLYGEKHSLDKGEHISEELMHGDVPDYDPDVIAATLPEESGWVLGGQIGLWGFGATSHLNLFARWAQDLAAYGEAGVPWGLDRDGTTEGAYEFVGALSANWEFYWAGVLAGGYLRKFKDADVNEYDTDDFVEGAFTVRPVIFLTDHLHQGFEFSYQEHYPFGLDEQSQEQEVSKVTQYSLMEIISLGRGSYRRPQLRLTYTISQPNGSARRTYPEGDLRRPDKTEHFLGLGVEWWFNSSTH